MLPFAAKVLAVVWNVWGRLRRLLHLESPEAHPYLELQVASNPPPAKPVMPAAPMASPASEIRRPIDYPALSGISTREIQTRIDTELSNLKPDEKGAVVAYVDTQGQARLSVFGKQGDHWTYVATATHAPAAGWGGQAEVRYSWK